MSQIGKNENFGKNFNVVMTHHGGYEILNSNKALYPNSFIISASQLTGDNGDDDCSYAILATDYLGYAVRLTYTIKEGNGLVVGNEFYNDNNKDVISLEIDHDSIDCSYNSYALQLVKTNVIDNDTLSVYQAYNETKTRIKVVTANLEKASDVAYGIVKGDNVTISTVNGLINVNTENLQYVDDETNKSGIVRFNPDIVGDYDWRTVEANNGVLHVVTKNLDIATEEYVGVVRPDMITTAVEQQTGLISVLTAGLDYATETSYGIVRSDNNTTEIVNGKIVAHPENMTGATTSTFGVVKLDEDSLGVDYAGYTYVQRYYEIAAILDRYMDDYDYIISRLNDHENRIAALENMAAAEYIYSFNNYGTSTTELEKPYWNGSEVISDVEFHTAVFSINTNCPFNVSFEFEDQSNVTPQITLQSVRLGNGSPIDASELQNETFPSTNSNESTLSFTFRCENYTSSTNEMFTLTNVTLKVSSINDSSIYKIGTHIFKRWNEAQFVENEVVHSYNYTITNSVSYTYYGPFLQYWTNGVAQNAVKTALDTLNNNEELGDVNDESSKLGTIAKEAGNLRTTQQTSSGTLVSTNTNGSVLSTGYCEGYGAYAVMGAYTGSRTSYSFMFSTVKLVKQVNTTNVSYYMDGELVNHYTDDEQTIVNPNWQPDWNDAPISTTLYSLGYMSSIYKSTTPQYAHDIMLGELTPYTRDMNYSGFNNEWTNQSSISGAGDWLSVNVSTLASNTGNYNVLRLSSSTPLIDNDRRATLSVRLPNTNTTDDCEVEDQRYKNVSTDTNIANIAAAFGAYKSLTFSLIEDIYEHEPNVHVNIELLENASNPLKITVNRSVNSSIKSNSSSWGVIIKFYYLTTSEPIGVNIANANIIADRGAGSSGSSDNILNDDGSINTEKTAYPTFDGNDVAAPIILKINIDPSCYTYEWNAYDDSTGRDSIIPKSVMDILSGSGANNISGITIDSITAFGFNYGGSSDSGLRTESEPSQVLVEKNDDITVTYSISGAWPTSSVQPNNSMTFGNASITAITVHPWPLENSIDIDFTLRPGDKTDNLNGAKINVLSRTAKLYVDNTVYNCTIDNDMYKNVDWDATGCTLKMRVSNIYTETAQQQNDRGTQYDGRGSQPSQTTVNPNGLDYISGIKVYFKVNATDPINQKTCVLDYATGINGNLTDKILVNAQNNIGISKSVSIPNALYNDNPGITISQEQQSQTSVEQLAELVNKLQNDLEQLQGEQQNSTTTK